MFKQKYLLRKLKLTYLAYSMYENYIFRKFPTRQWPTFYLGGPEYPSLPPTHPPPHPHPHKNPPGKL